MPRLNSVNGCSGRSRELHVEDAQVALALPGLGIGALVGTGVDHEYVGPRHLAVRPADGGQDLLVDPPFEPQVGPVAEELDVVDHRHVERSIVLAARAVDLHDVTEDRRIRAAVSQVTQPAAAIRGDGVVRIHPEEPLASSMAQRLVAGGREVVAPGEVEQPPAVATRRSAASHRSSRCRRSPSRRPRAGCSPGTPVASGPSRGRSCRARAGPARDAGVTRRPGSPRALER